MLTRRGTIVLIAAITALLVGTGVVAYLVHTPPVEARPAAASSTAPAPVVPDPETYGDAEGYAEPEYDVPESWEIADPTPVTITLSVDSEPGFFGSYMVDRHDDQVPQQVSFDIPASGW